MTKVILRLGLHPIIMEAFNPTDRNALQLCYDKVQEAEIFIGIYAHRYGYAPGPDVSYTLPDGTAKTGDSETGITHLEYLWAMERKLPMLLFVIGDTDAAGEPLAWPVAHIEDEPGKSRLKAFKNLVMGRHVVGFFHSPDHLATQVATGLADAMRQIQPSDKANLARPRRDHLPYGLPEHYVPRRDLLDELRLTILGDDEQDAPAQGMIALHGMGGIGKSVIARALCDDPAIRAAFPDGVLWAQLASEISDADILSRLRDWVAALGGSISEAVPTLDGLKATLNELLKERACLLVVDDVWHKKQAQAFRVGGENCRLLLTTRNAEVARGLGARVQPIPAMSEAEALNLLKLWADGALSGADGGLLARIIKALGRLPLAIKLAGAQLQRKAPDKWLADFDARKLKSKRPEDVHDSLEQTFGLSLEQLEDAERRLYAALAIFKEDEPIREVAIQRLWSGLDERDADDAQDLLDDLAARALLEVVGDQYPRAALLHDLLRDFMAAELGDPQAAHQALLDTYRATQTGDGWHTAPDDGYLYGHLAYHLNAIKDYSAMRALFVNQDWMNVRVPADGWRYIGFVNDLEIYWLHIEHLADSEAKSGIHNPKTSLEVFRYAVIRTSINSLSASYSKELIYAAVENNFWSLSRALGIIELLDDEWRRQEYYLELLKLTHLTHSDKEHLISLSGLDPQEGFFTVQGKVNEREFFGNIPFKILIHPDILSFLPYLSQSDRRNLLVFACHIYDRNRFYEFLADASFILYKGERERTFQSMRDVVRTIGTYLPEYVVNDVLENLPDDIYRDEITYALQNPQPHIYLPGPIYDQDETSRHLYDAVNLYSADASALFHLLTALRLFCEEEVSKHLVELVISETQHLTKLTTPFVLHSFFNEQNHSIQQQLIDFYLSRIEIEDGDSFYFDDDYDAIPQANFTHIPLSDWWIDYSCEVTP